MSIIKTLYIDLPGLNTPTQTRLITHTHLAIVLVNIHPTRSRLLPQWLSPADLQDIYYHLWRNKIKHFYLTSLKVIVKVLLQWIDSACQLPQATCQYLSIIGHAWRLGTSWATMAMKCGGGGVNAGSVRSRIWPIWG